MTPEHKALVAELLDPNFEGAFQHVRSYSEIDRLFRQAASAIESLSAQCAQLQAGEPTGYIDRQRQKFASIEKHDIATLAKGGWTPVYLASPQPANPAQVTDAVRADWQRIDDALVSCASLIRALASDDVATVAAAELDYVRSALAASHMPVGDGVTLIAAERRRQIEAEGWTPEHDDTEHDHGDLAAAGSAYALHAADVLNPYSQGDGRDVIPDFWPFGKKWWKPSDDPVRTLEKAGALIAAEIDRLKRTAARAGEDGE